MSKELPKPKCADPSEIASIGAFCCMAICVMTCAWAFQVPVRASRSVCYSVNSSSACDDFNTTRCRVGDSNPNCTFDICNWVDTTSSTFKDILDAWPSLYNYPEFAEPR